MSVPVFPANPPIVVIGAGAAGLSAALHLAEAGRRVLVLEAGRRLGGRASSFADARSGLDLDWGPHLFMAANPALRALLGSAGAGEALRFSPSLELAYRVAAAPETGEVRGARLAFPSGGGLAGQVLAMLRWRGPGLGARWGIARSLSRLLSRREPGGEEETVAAMLGRLGQEEEACAWFWEPFARAVLNLPLEMGSAALFRRVVREAFGNGPSGAALGVPQRPLGALWEACAGAIRRLGGEVRTSVPVQRIEAGEGCVRGLVLGGGERLSARAVVSAVPPPALRAMLPGGLEGEAPWSGLRRLRPGPIASAYLWLDRPAPGPAFEALVGEPWHWLFRPAAAGGEDACPVALLAGGEDSVASETRETLVHTARKTAARVLPGSKVERTLVVRERAATWANGVDEQAWRLPARAPLTGLFLAGDWTATGLPATVEGAVRSGASAAEAVLSSQRETNCDGSEKQLPGSHESGPRL